MRDICSTFDDNNSVIDRRYLKYVHLYAGRHRRHRSGTLAAGLLLPPLFMLVYPWQMGSIWTLAMIGMVACLGGLLVGRWWAVAVVPAGMVGAMAGYALMVHGRLLIAEGSFTIAESLIVLGVMACLTGCLTLSGVLMSWFLPVGQR